MINTRTKSPCNPSWSCTPEMSKIFLINVIIFSWSHSWNDFRILHQITGRQDKQVFGSVKMNLPLMTKATPRRWLFHKHWQMHCLLVVKYFTCFYSYVKLLHWNPGLICSQMYSVKGESWNFLVHTVEEHETGNSFYYGQCAANFAQNLVSERVKDSDVQENDKNWRRTEKDRKWMCKVDRKSLVNTPK